MTCKWSLQTEVESKSIGGVHYSEYVIESEII